MWWLGLKDCGSIFVSPLYPASTLSKATTALLLISLEPGRMRPTLPNDNILIVWCWFVLLHWGGTSEQLSPGSGSDYRGEGVQLTHSSRGITEEW